MTWPKYVLLAWFAYAAILNITQIGKPREPLKPNIAAGSLILTGGLAWLIVIA